MTWIVIYAIGWLVTAPIIARVIAHDDRRLRGQAIIEPSTWLYAAAMGSIAAVFWWLVVPFGLTWILVRTIEAWGLTLRDAARTPTSTPTERTHDE